MYLYDSTSYKEALKETLKLKRQNVGPSYTYQRLAAACKVQKTYLSRVLNSDGANLSEEQLYLACRYLGLGRGERDFLQLLRLRDRASSEDYRRELEGEIEEICKKQRKTGTHLSVKPTPMQPADWGAYYLNPNVMLTHIFMTVPRYRDNLKDLAAALSVSREELDEIIRTLERMELVQFTDDGHRVTNKQTHLPNDSSLYQSFRTLQRVKALEKLNRLDTDKAYSFSVAFSSNAKVREQLQQKIFALISEAEKLVSEGTEEEVYQLNIDLFDWT